MKVKERKWTIAVGASSFGQADRRALALLEATNVQVRPNPFGRKLTEAETIAHLQGADGLLAGLEPLTRSVLCQAKDLKAIVRIGIGMENVDLEAAKDLNISVANTPDAPTSAVAELVVGAMLNLTRGILQANSRMHRGEWSKVMGRGLGGLTILLIGFGRIGRQVATYLRAFEPKILVFDPAFRNGSVEPEIECVSTLEEGLTRAEVISLHANGSQEILGKSELAQLRPGSWLLNSARGGLVNESALIEALESGRLAGIWLDTFWQEPYSGPLIGRENVLLTSHMGTYTQECRAAMEVTAARLLLDALGT